jgi:hypothetical protein
MKQGPFPPAELCCPAPSSGTTTPSDSLVAAHHFPVVAGYRQALLPGPAARGHRGPLQFPRHPSDRSTPPTPEGSWAPAPGSLVPSMAFASGIQARLPLGPLTRGFLTTLQASLHAADRPVARPVSRGGLPPPRRRDLARRRECCYRGPWRLPGPDSHRLAAVSLALGYTLVPPFITRRPSYWTHIPPESTGPAGPGAAGDERRRLGVGQGDHLQLPSTEHQLESFRRTPLSS